MDVRKQAIAGRVIVKNNEFTYPLVGARKHETEEK